MSTGFGTSGLDLCDNRFHLAVVREQLGALQSLALFRCEVQRTATTEYKFLAKGVYRSAFGDTDTKAARTVSMAARYSSMTSRDSMGITSCLQG